MFFTYINETKNPTYTRCTTYSLILFHLVFFTLLFSTYSFYFPILAPDIRPPPPTLLTGILEPPPPPPGVEPDQDDIGIKFKSFDLNKVEHEPPRTLAGYEAEVNVWPIFKFTYMKMLLFQL